MSKVNVRLNEMFAAPGNVLVKVTSVLILGQNVVSGSTGILPGTDSERTDLSGFAQFVLQTGRYQIYAKSPTIDGLAYQPIIDVPDDTATYEHTQLIVSGAAPFSQPIATNVDASDVSFGLVRLTSNGKAIPESVDTVALLRAVATARAAIAQLAFVFGGAAIGDGGGGIYRWDAAGAEADDGVGILRPGDFAAAGVWKKFL